MAQSGEGLSATKDVRGAENWADGSRLRFGISCHQCPAVLSVGCPEAVTGL